MVGTNEHFEMDWADLMTSKTIDDDLDAQESVVLVFDLQQAKSSRHQG